MGIPFQDRNIVALHLIFFAFKKIVINLRYEEWFARPFWVGGRDECARNSKKSNAAKKKGIAGERVESLGAEPWTRSLSLVILTKDRGTSDVRYGQEP